MTKFGSQAIPNKPRSPLELTFRVKKGVARTAPFLITRNSPVCWHTKSRPSGANAIAVGALNPVMMVSVKPAGSVAALIAGGRTASASDSTTRSHHVCEILDRYFLPLRGAHTPTAKGNVMLFSKSESFKAEDAARAG